MEVQGGNTTATATATAGQTPLADAQMSPTVEIDNRHTVRQKVEDALAAGQRVIEFSAPGGAGAVVDMGGLVVKALGQPIVVINGENAWEISFYGPNEATSAKTLGLIGRRIAEGRVIVVNNVDELTAEQSSILQQYCKALSEKQTFLELTNGTEKMQVPLSLDARVILRHAGMWGFTAPVER
jgi:hypothetical protein